MGGIYFMPDGNMPYLDGNSRVQTELSPSQTGIRPLQTGLSQKLIKKRMTYPHCSWSFLLINMISGKPLYYLVNEHTKDK